MTGGGNFAPQNYYGREGKGMKKKKKSISYGKWGQIFILPFFIIYFIFSADSVGRYRQIQFL